VIDAYVADVARDEDAFLAAADEKARHGAAAAVTSGPAPPPPAAIADPVAPTEDLSSSLEGRWGSREVEIVSVDLLDAEDQAAHVFQSGAAMTVRLGVRAHRTVEDFVFGVGIFSADGVAVYGTNTDVEHFKPGRLSGEATVALRFDALDLTEGTYKLDVAVHTRDGAPYDYHRLLHTIRVKSRTKDVGVYRPPHHWTFTGDVTFMKTPEP
jgi:hypothetical protein